MKHSIKTRIKAAALAAMMLLTSVPVSALTAVRAEAADGLELNYLYQDDPKTAIVITGRDATIMETIPSGYVSQGMNLNRVKDNETDTDGAYPVTVKEGTTPSDNGVAISLRQPNGTRTIRFGKNFDPTAQTETASKTASKQPTDPGIGTYTIDGLYRAILQSGSVNITTADATYSLGASGTVNFTSSVAVTEFSRMVLVCTGREYTLGGGATFRVKGVGDNATTESADAPVGSFKQFTDTTGNRITGVSMERYDSTDLKKIRFSVYSGSYVLNIETNANIAFAAKADDVGDYLDEDGKKTNRPTVTEEGVTYPDYCIREGTEFEIIYRMPSVEPLYVTVVTPQTAIENIEGMIQTEQNQFINLANGDTLDYITDNFNLRHAISRYNADFQIKWTWTPMRELGDNGDWKTLTDAQKAKDEYKNIVKPGGFNTEWQPATITPLVDDVEGTLTATVYYVYNGNSQRTNTDGKALGETTGGAGEGPEEGGGEEEDPAPGGGEDDPPAGGDDDETEVVVGQLPTLNITVRGTGKAVTVYGGRQLTGDADDDTEEPETPEEPEDPEEPEEPGNSGSTSGSNGQETPPAGFPNKLAPNTVHRIAMDAYRGGLKDLITINPKGPYQYDIRLQMGEKNGAAMYAIVEASGSTDAVTLQTKEGATGAFRNYTPGEQIRNTLFGQNGNTAQGWAELRVTANPFDVGAPANQTPSVTLTIRFYLSGRNNQAELSSDVYTINFTISDSTPSQDSSLKSLTIQGYDPEKKLITDTIPFDFMPDLLNYTDQEHIVHIPYLYESIVITPTLNDSRGSGNQMGFYIRDGAKLTRVDTMYAGTSSDNITIQEDGGGSHAAYALTSGRPSKEIRLYDNANKDKTTNAYINEPYDLVITVPSQDPRPRYWSDYVVTVVRDAPSEDNTLKSLGIYLEEADPDDPENNLIEQYGTFDPNTLEYDIEIPYSTQLLRVRAEKNHDQADFKLSETQVLDGGNNGSQIYEENGTPYKLQGIPDLNPNKEWLKDLKDHFRLVTDETGTMTLKFSVTSEAGRVNGGGVREYTVHIHRAEASDDAFMSGFIVTDNDENVQTYTPAFSPDNNTYTLNIPYSVRQIKFNINTNDPNVSAVELWEFNTSFGRHNGTMLLSLGNDDAAKSLQLGVLTRGIDVLDISDENVQNRDGYHPFYIYLSPESEKADKVQEYLLRVRREEPSHDAKLTDLQLKDQSNADINTFAFHPDETEYHITVPYSTTGVSFTPTTSHPYATVEIQETGLLSGIVGTLFPYIVESGATSKVFQLLNEAEKEKEFRVVVHAEDYSTDKKTGTELIYYVFISREPPSDDARLKSLVTQNTSNFKPIFISSRLEYTADVNEGAPGVIIIPTANHPGATIRVDGVVVQSGSPTDLIELLEVTQTVRIEVIAEDGVTRMVYRITFTNWNLVEKTSNADLRNLTVNYGLMTPNFQAAVLDYEVTTKENAWSVDIIPRLADPLATMRVLNGTLELGDYNGNYAMAITDGLNEVSVEVTSPDKTVTKTYSVDIYRNDEEKLKNWTPLEAEDINFEMVGNPIIVKIEEYPRVGASVFNTIREEYPDRSIIFQGNDYSIRFDGVNLTRVIPQTEIYDFQMSLTSPDEDAIYDLIAEYGYNDDIINDIVMLYFDYHGSLPGPATFSLSLGRHYGNDLLYWHYYNKERDRIDYYGTLQSNSQGNIAVSIDHFSTYVVSPEHRIAGSEDKDGVVDELGMVSNGQDLLGSGGKLNPDTGVPAATAGAADQAAGSGILPSPGKRPDLYIRKKETP